MNFWEKLFGSASSKPSDSLSSALFGTEPKRENAWDIVLQRRIADGSIDKYIQTIAERYSLNVPAFKINAHYLLASEKDIDPVVLFAGAGMSEQIVSEAAEAFSVEIIRPLRIESRAEFMRYMSGQTDDGTPQFCPPESGFSSAYPVTRQVVVGPSHAKYPCSRLFPSPEFGDPGWHEAEIQRLIAIWQLQHPKAKITRISLRKDTVYSLRTFADITYELPAS